MRVPGPYPVPLMKPLNETFDFPSSYVHNGVFNTHFQDRGQMKVGEVHKRKRCMYGYGMYRCGGINLILLLEVLV